MNPTNGKGDKRIAAQVSPKQVSDNWDRIFGKKDPTKADKPAPQQTTKG